jgi:hypothetical protein
MALFALILVVALLGYCTVRDQSPRVAFKAIWTLLTGLVAKLRKKDPAA